MRNTLSLLAILCLCSITKKLFAQDKSPVKFGKIAPEDFKVSGPLFDSSAKAVILAEVGESEFIGNPKGYFSIIFKRQTRAIIMDQRGIGAATVEIPLYTSGTETEVVDALKAHTYNLENGKVVVTKMDASAVFTEKRTKNLSILKFTLPAVKPGSIIEYTYNLKSDFLFNLRGWEFQGEYPRLWSEYTTYIPEFFKYVGSYQTLRTFDINTEVQRSGYWDVTTQSQAGIGLGGQGDSPGKAIHSGLRGTEHTTLDGQLFTHRWVMKNVPAFKEEPFTSSSNNHISKVEFQLYTIQWPGREPQLVMDSWGRVADELMRTTEFGDEIDDANNWLDDDMKEIVGDAKTSREMTQLIFRYVRDHVSCNGLHGIYKHETLSRVWRAKQGSVAEVNLLLAAMLDHEKIDVHPVILSCRDHGFVNPDYPILPKYDYVICRVKTEDGYLLLDATHRNLPFGRLHWSLYNGQARVVDPNDPATINLVADSVHESSLTVKTIEGGNDGAWTETVKSTLGRFASYNLRNLVSGKEGLLTYTHQKQDEYGNAAEVSDVALDSLNHLSDPVTVHYNVKYKFNGDEGLIYLNPLLGETMKANPFISDKREYPVEMPFTTDATVIVYATIPEGYVIDELPKSAKMNFYENEGGFECMYYKGNGGFQLKYRFHLNVANFPADSYEDLRSFYGAVIKKISEPVVLRKVK